MTQRPPFIFDPDITAIFAIAKRAGGEARLVGGVVRNWLMGLSLSDYDMAVNLPITVFSDMAEQAGLRVIPTGLSHGSVTVISGMHQIEVTQTRADISTDGRHAVIGFAPDFTADASRRDFTINALYLDEEGTLFDPLDGQGDIARCQLRFIGDAKQRIAEDYLRILRAFRLMSQMPQLSLSEQDVQAIYAMREGLLQLSGNRIGAEMQKCLGGDGWQKAVSALADCDCDKVLFGTAFQVLSDGLFDGISYQDLTENWLARLALLLPETAQQAIFEKCAMSNADKAYLMSLYQPFSKAELTGLMGKDWQKIAYFHQGDSLADRLLVQSYYQKPDITKSRLRQIAQFTAPPCPVSGHDLRQAGIGEGPEIGKLLLQAKQLFADSDFSADKQTILAALTDA